MKKLIFICLLLAVTGCKRTDEKPSYESEGTITGYDLRTCAMCGGLEITIKNDTTKNAPPFYEINSSLQQLGISEITPFPIKVNLNWKRDTSPLGAYNYIVVSQIKVIN